MKILHSYCLNYNVGDYALGFGVKNLLRRYLPTEFIAQTNLQGRVFDDYYINDVVNKKYDLLVIGGGGIIHGAHWPQGWFWLIQEESFSKIRIPFIVYGAGYNYFPNEAGIPSRGVRHLKATKAHASYFSVRNDGSHARLLDATGIDADVVPDPGFHVSLGRDWGARETDNFVVLQVAGDKLESRFGSLVNVNEFIGRMRMVVDSLAKRYRVIAIPHVWDDIAISRAITDGFSRCETLDFGRFAFDRCDALMKYYRDAEFTLAMRGHGQIIPLGFRTPVISFSTHAKIDGMMRALGLDKFHVEIAHNDFVERVLATVALIEESRSGVICQIDRSLRLMEQNSEAAFAKIVAALKRS